MIKEPQLIDGAVRLMFEGGPSVDLKPQDCWQMAQRLRLFIMDRWTEMHPPPVHAVRKNKRQFNVVVTKHANFWRSLQQGGWERHTFQIFDRFISADCTFLDIGSWIGPTVLYGAQLAGQTYGFEPDPVAYQELEANLNANAAAPWAGTVQIANKAMSFERGRMKLGSRTSGGDSMTSVLFSDKTTNWEVETASFREFVSSDALHARKLFVKIDIEGGEFTLLPRIRDVLASRDATLYLSVHSEFLYDSLRKGSGKGLGDRLRCRWAFFRKHLELMQALPFRFLYLSSGRPMPKWRHLWNALRHGAFVEEVVGTNERW